MRTCWTVTRSGSGPGGGVGAGAGAGDGPPFSEQPAKATRTASDRQRIMNPPVTSRNYTDPRWFFERCWCTILPVHQYTEAGAMFLRVEPASPVPLYRQIMDQLRMAVAAGR